MKRSREQHEEDLETDYPPGNTNRSVVRAITFQQPVNKITELDCAVEDDEDDSPIMRCHLPPHKDAMTFRSYAEYETHYSKEHSHRCLDCRKNFPSEHLLEIHIEEFHDPLLVVKRDKGEHTYSCFVEGCERKCMTHQKRRMHMIDKHMYPKNFFFAVTKEGIDGRRSLLVESGHRRRSSTLSSTKESRRRASLVDQGKVQVKDESAAKPEPEVLATKLAEEKGQAGSEKVTDTDMTDLTGAMSALQFVPQSVRFGRGRAGFAKANK